MAKHSSIDVSAAIEHALRERITTLLQSRRVGVGLTAASAPKEASLLDQENLLPAVSGEDGALATLKILQTEVSDCDDLTPKQVKDHLEYICARYARSFLGTKKELTVAYKRSLGHSQDKGGFQGEAPKRVRQSRDSKQNNQEDVDLVKESLKRVEEQSLDVTEAAAYLKLSKIRVQELAKRGDIGVKVKGRYLFSPLELDLYDQKERPTGVHQDN